MGLEQYNRKGPKEFAWSKFEGMEVGINIAQTA